MTSTVAFTQRWRVSDHPAPAFITPTAGKRSIAVDIRHQEGREILLQLVAEADVFMTSVRGGRH